MNHQDIGGLLLTGSIEGHETLALFALGSPDFLPGRCRSGCTKIFGRATRIVCIEDRAAGIKNEGDDVDDSIAAAFYCCF